MKILDESLELNNYGDMSEFRKTVKGDGAKNEKAANREMPDISILD